MSLNRYNPKRDKNEREIISACLKLGAKVWQQSRPCDLLLAYCGEFLTFEVKDGSLPPSARKLTDYEAEYAELCAEIGVPHFLVTSAEQAVAILVERRGRSH